MAGVLIAVGVIVMPLGVAIPNPFACGPAGSSTSGGMGNPHNYDIDTAGVLTVVYDQCLAHYVPDTSNLPDSLLASSDDEWAAGIDGAFFMSADDVVGVNDPSNDVVNHANTDPYTTVNPANVGGVNNCLGASFTPHHGVDGTINTADLIMGGNLLVFVTADRHDDPGEQAYNEILAMNGGVWPGGIADPRDPCGDNAAGSADYFHTSKPCGFHLLPTPGPNCAVNVFGTGTTLGAVAGLDGNVVTFIGISTGNLSIGTTGTAWTTPEHGVPPPDEPWDSDPRASSGLCVMHYCPV